MDLLDLLFLACLVLTLIQKLAESIYSISNQKLLSSKGFSLRESKQHRMKLSISYFFWIFFMLLEWQLNILQISSWLRVIALIVFFLAQALRLWSLHSLGWHWSSQIFAPEKVQTPSLGALTEEAMISGKTERVERGLLEDLFVESGPYRFIRHPFYLAQILEIMTLPLAGSAILTALVFSAINKIFLNKQIELEESWLFSRPGYHELFYHKSRFIPF